MTDLVKMEAMRGRLKKEAEDVIKELGDLVEEISKDYATLSALPEAEAISAVTEVSTSVVLEFVKLPWYVPKWLAEKLITTAIMSLVKKKAA